MELRDTFNRHNGDELTVVLAEHSAPSNPGSVGRFLRPQFGHGLWRGGDNARAFGFAFPPTGPFWAPGAFPRSHVVQRFLTRAATAPAHYAAPRPAGAGRERGGSAEGTEQAGPALDWENSVTASLVSRISYFVTRCFSNTPLSGTHCHAAPLSP